MGFVHALLLAVFASSVCGGDVILKPVKQTSKHVALVFIQGAQITPEQYVPLFKAVQEATTSYSVWVGIPQFFADIADPLTIAKDVDKILSAMRAEGMSSESLFLAGHSLGGAVVQGYVAGNSKNVHGQILMGATLLRKYRNETYPVPTLTMGGELDGLNRVTRIMEEYFHRMLHPSSSALVDLFPVIVIKGMNHFEFASGSMPFSVKERDLKAEISFDQAYSIVATYVAAFISARLGNSTAEGILRQAVQSTGKFVAPMVDAYSLEGSYHFKPPCYDNPTSSACQVGSPFMPTAASIVGGLKEGMIEDQDEFHPFSQVPGHLPHILNNCSVPSTSCVLHTTTVSDNIYEIGDKLDTGFFSNSASEIRAKFKSRQVMWTAAGYHNVDFNSTDGPAVSLCRAVNQHTYTSALNTLQSTAGGTLSRFLAYGVPMVMVKDRGPFNAGPLFITNHLEYTKAKNSTGGDIIEVSSATLVTPDNYFVQAVAGMHYCKLLSPARVLEWVYVDGLRDHYSVNQTTSV